MMPISEKAEEILEQLWEMIHEMNKDVVDFQDINIQKTSPEIQELLSVNYIEVSDDKIKLTAEGRKEAEGVIRRHRLAERLMVDVFDIKEMSVEKTACRFEHLLHKEVEESVCTLLGHPEFCPHGKSIPKGRCCQKHARLTSSVVLNISEVENGTKGKIAYLRTRDSRKLQKLMAMNLLPGVSIELIQKFPSYVFKVSNTQIALDKETASDIFIRVKREQ